MWFNDVTGMTFNRLTAIRYKKTNKGPLWLFKCICGNEIWRKAGSVKFGKPKSCGCLRRETSSATCKTAEVDIAGRAFGRLTALSKVDSSHWLFKCSCGIEKIINKHDVTRDRGVKSCGCLRTELLRRPRTHGLSKHRIYSIWRSMHKRCYSKTHIAYKRYSEKGIIVCKRWHKFESFVKSMGMPPSNKHCIDRINNSDIYKPSNCRWATHAENNLNRSDNVFIEWQNKRMTVSQWCRELNMTRTMLDGRIKKFGINRPEMLFHIGRYPCGPGGREFK